MKTQTVERIVEQYREAGWLAFIYPRRREVSLNGHAAIPYTEAVAKMRAALKAQFERETAAYRGHGLKYDPNS